MKNFYKTSVLLLGIIFSAGCLMFVLEWTGYSSWFKTYVENFREQSITTDEEVLALQKREMELITEMGNQKILEAIKEQQKSLEEQQLSLQEKENNINALATALEEEKNNFLKSQELVQKTQQEKENYLEKIGSLAVTFTSMPPDKAVERIVTLGDDLLIIDVMSEIDRKAEEDGLTSITSLYYSLMDEKDASRILKKTTVAF